MTLFIQNNTAIGGTGAVFPNNAEADLLRISDLDLAGFGETTQPPPSNLIQVTYEPQATTGFPPTRLHELVNTDFMGVAGNVDIIVVAVTETFLFEGTTPIENVGGVTIPPSSGANTTSSVLVIYNTGSSNICEKAEGGGFDLGSPPPVTLFHELSHAFRMATTGLLDTTESNCHSEEEEAAEKDENAMRELMGVRKRDATNHCGEHCTAPSNGNCCIVASIATGSESVEVSALRLFREGSLRRSEVGHAFFERLHYDYYGYSPRVCTAMGNNEPLVEQIRSFFVRPLTRSLTLVRALLETGAPEAEVGERLDRSLERELDPADAAELESALEMVRSGRPAPELLPPQLRDLDWVGVGPHLRWGILEPIGLYLQAAQERFAGAAPEELGRDFAARVEDWAARLPLDPIWDELSNFELERELGFLRGSLLSKPRSRELFGRRLLAQTGVEPGLALSVLEESDHPEGVS